MSERVGLLRLLLLRRRLYRTASECLLHVLWECTAGNEGLLCRLWAIAAESSTCVICLHWLQLRWLSLDCLLLRLTEGICRLAERIGGHVATHEAVCRLLLKPLHRLLESCREAKLGCSKACLLCSDIS